MTWSLILNLYRFFLGNILVQIDVKDKDHKKSVWYVQIFLMIFFFD